MEDREMALRRERPEGYLSASPDMAGGERSGRHHLLAKRLPPAALRRTGSCTG